MASGEEVNHKTNKTRLECKSVMCLQVSVVVHHPHHTLIRHRRRPQPTQPTQIHSFFCLGPDQSIAVSCRCYDVISYLMMMTT